MVKKLNPSFVAYFATYLKGLLSKPPAQITAVMFQEQVTAAANKYLDENYGVGPNDVRSAIAQSTPEAECANAIKARRLHGIADDPRISEYKTQAEISGLSSPDTLERAREAHKDVKDWTSKTNMLLYDDTAEKMRQQSVPFNIETAVYCGNCWICNTDVMSYTGTSTQDHRTEINSPNKYWLSGTTPCGDCEHVSAIMASYIAGMLKSAEFAKFYWASYYVACVECNRKKSNYIGVRLHATRGWEVDADGVEAILNAIFSKNTVKIHESEYNPIRNALTNKYNNMPFAEKEDFRASVRANITSGTQTWCKTANDNMQKATATTKHLKMAFNVSKIIVAITGHLNVITGPLEKKAKKKANSKVVKVARPGAKSTVKPKKGGAPTGSELISQVSSADKQDSDVEMAPPLPPALGSALNSQVSSDSTEESDEEVASLDTANVDNDVVMEPQANSDDDTDDYIMHWNNLLDNEEDDDETEYEVNTETKQIIVTYIGKIYGPRLFEQYKLGLPIIDSDPSIFDDLMVNLSTSMNDVLKPIPDIEPGQVSSRTPQKRPTALKPIQITPAKTDSKTTTIGPDDDAADTTRSKTPIVEEIDAAADSDDAPDSDDAQRKKRSRLNETESRQFGSIDLASKLPSVGPEEGTQTQTYGGSLINKRHSKNRTKRVSYIKHKQTRKNYHSRKTNKK